MAKFIESPVITKAAGNIPKIIEEFIGCVNSGTNEVSIARMKSPAGWIEPGQTPEFNEYTIVLKGILHVKTKNELNIVRTGQAIIINKGEWVQYSSPEEEGAEYVAICLPAFSMEIVHRDE
jgi:ethanolamine utilization protein EutQ (cupin superfamily)